MEKYNLNYLKQLEAESIHIIREAMAEFKNPVMLYSIGKDSSVLLRLAQKAFYPAKIPFPLLHIDTGFKFKEMIEFRDYYTKKIDAKLIVHSNKEEKAMEFGAQDAHTDEYIYYKKTKPLLEAIEKYNFDAAISGSRREEEKSRAKERIFSIRNEMGAWDPKNQRPEVWNIYNARLNQGDSMRVFPLSNWTEVDIWEYIKQEEIEVVPLYFAQRRKVVERHNNLIRVDEFTQPEAGENVKEIVCRYRTLGCAPSTGAVESEAKNIDDILIELSETKKSERVNRAIDNSSDAAMEKKKKEGYF